MDLDDHRRRVLNIWRQLEHRHRFCPTSIGIYPDALLANHWKCSDCVALFPELPMLSAIHATVRHEPCPCPFFKDNDHVDARVDLALDGKLAGLEHLTYLDREG